jgi:hypothetical protein
MQAQQMQMQFAHEFFDRFPPRNKKAVGYLTHEHNGAASGA